MRETLVSVGENLRAVGIGVRALLFNMRGKFPTHGYGETTRTKGKETKEVMYLSRYTNQIYCIRCIGENSKKLVGSIIAPINYSDGMELCLEEKDFCCVCHHCCMAVYEYVQLVNQIERSTNYRSRERRV